MIFSILLLSLNSVGAYATPKLEVLESYFNPIVGIGVFGPTIPNSGNSTAYNIKLTIIDVNDAYTIVQETPLKDTLEAGENMFTKYLLTPTKLGQVELQYVLTWEDEDGNKYSIDNKNKPIKLFNASFATSETPAPTGISTTQLALIGSGIAIIAVIGGIYLAKMKKRVLNGTLHG
jgi:hypothetical protein